MLVERAIDASRLLAALGDVPSHTEEIQALPQSFSSRSHWSISGGAQRLQSNGKQRQWLINDLYHFSLFYSFIFVIILIFVIFIIYIRAIIFVFFPFFFFLVAYNVKHVRFLEGCL